MLVATHDEHVEAFDQTGAVLPVACEGQVLAQRSVTMRDLLLGKAWLFGMDVSPSRCASIEPTLERLPLRAIPSFE
jgi:hypothetical protein